MNFNSPQFVAFLAVTLLLFISSPLRFRKGLLLLASYLFYASWSIPFIGVIFLTTNADYFLSHLIHKETLKVRKRLYLIAGLAINLSILGAFKYTNFFLQQSHGIASWLGRPLDLPVHLEILLPLGISFYTFEAISYLVDVYRGKEPSRSWLDYNFYIMYFPHLISGPIIRFEELVSQISGKIALPVRERFLKGFELLMLGFLFKIAIADFVAPWVDPVFANPENATSLSTLLATLAFTVQIYFDFMGYTHIARGCSLFFNIELPLNFNHPYLATSISDFWRRWHITLSRWIRDYLYIPLGGSRHSLVRTCLNLTVTMLLCGAWHGAGWTFILWGGYHGILLSLNHLTKRLKNSLPTWELFSEYQAYRVISVFITFICVIAGWIIFRADSLPTAGILLVKLFNLPVLLSDATTSLNIHLALKFAFLFACCFSGPMLVPPAQKIYRNLPYWAKVEVGFAVTLACWFLTRKETTPFIYFQF